MRGLIVAGRGIMLFGSGVQVLSAGNAIDLLEDVRELVQAGPEDSDRHGARNSAASACRSNHDKPLSAVTFGIAA